MTDHAYCRSEAIGDSNCEKWSEESSSRLASLFVAYMKMMQFPRERIFQQLSTDLKDNRTPSQCEQRILSMIQCDQNLIHDKKITLPKNAKVLDEMEQYDVIYVETPLLNYVKRDATDKHGNDKNDIIMLWTTMLELDRKSEEGARQRRIERMTNKARLQKELLEWERKNLEF